MRRSQRSGCRRCGGWRRAPGGLHRWDRPRQVAPPRRRGRPAASPSAPRRRLAELGRQHKTAQALYEALEGRGQGRPAAGLGGDAGLERGVLAPGGQGLHLRSRISRRASLTTAKLTPEYQAKLEKRVADVKKGIEWDPISTCAPPGHPRWLTEPFLREFVVDARTRRGSINEMVNDIRRVYTDGRDHVPEEDRYPLYNGDSIGFWDGDKLVVHTNQLMAGHLPAPESRLHRAGRDRGDLAQGRRQDADRRRVGLRPAGARRTVVRQAGLREAERSATCGSATGTAPRTRTTPCSRPATAPRSSTTSPSRRRTMRSEASDETRGEGGGGRRPRRRRHADVCLGTRLGPPFRGHVRREEDRDRRGRGEGVPADQPALVAAGGRHRQERQGRDVGIRGGRAQHAAPRRHQAERPAAGHEADHHRQPDEGRASGGHLGERRPRRRA